MVRRLLETGAVYFASVGLVASLTGGCHAAKSRDEREWAVRASIERFTALQREELATHFVQHASTELLLWPRTDGARVARVDWFWDTVSAVDIESFLDFRTPPLLGQNVPESQPLATRPAGPPSDYWRKDLWHQMGHEAKALGTHDFWRGFKTSFWDLENTLALTATMGASIAIRESGVDSTVRGRIRGHQQLGEFDEPIQILGHPGTHFAGAGVLWLASALAQDTREHEVAKSLAQALAVNGVTTILLKAAANTRAPDGEPYAWPSGHTSSAFTVAAVLNEYYGPWAGVPSLALAGLVGYQRVDSRVHDFSDVVFGAMLGYVVGSSIARDKKAAFPEIFGMQVVPFVDPETGASGLALVGGF